MKFFNNVLKQSTIFQYFEELSTKVSKQDWLISNISWNKDLLLSCSGAVYSSNVSQSLQNNIIKDLGHHLPNCSRCIIQHYLWDKNSGISKHEDADRVFGATVYLNEEWDVNNGGLFLWKHTNTPETNWQAYVPQFNSMVLNDQKEMHLVTSVSPNIKEFRFTIQIWGF